MADDRQEKKREGVGSHTVPEALFIDLLLITCGPYVTFP